MKIRWSIVFLALFGVVAALAAAVLTASLSAQGIQAARTPEVTEVTVLVAAKDLAAMQTVTMADVVEKVVHVNAAPGSYYSDPAQIVGKVLSLPVIEGQTYTDNNFPSEGSGLLLASHLPKGKRAVQIALEDYSGLEGLLYPGCIVDVVASFRVDVSTRLGRAVSTTLLQNIQVLGVQGSTVVDKQSREDEADSRARASRNMNKSILVTLMVDSRQAEALTLAMEHGSISLALRNPGDEAIATSEATLLAEGKLAQLAEMLAPKVGGGERNGEIRELGITEEMQTAAAENVDEDGIAIEPVPASSLQARNDGPNYWQVDVIRGLVSQPTQIKVQD